ncbi:MAG: hypothetical protein P8R54_24405 [Myxococcota bacterium]|nr:hypothetical protein [Myxococcota bacterium]
MSTLIITALLSSAFAGTTRAEAHASASELTQGYRDIQDDTADLRSLEAIISNWQTASHRGAHGAEMTADRALESWIRRELAESQAELSRARSEVKASKNELARETAQAQRSYGRHASHEYAQVRDDKRDLQDDRRDLSTLEAQLSSMQAIAKQLNAMQPAFEHGRASARDYATKRNLLDRLRSLSQREISLTRAELSEDLAEQRESRWD